MSRDNDEDYLPLVQDVELAQHISCLTCDMTTSGHMHTKPLMLLPGASAHGSVKHSRETPEPPPQNAKIMVAP